MTLRDLERITLHGIIIEVSKPNGGVIYCGDINKMIGDIWKKEIIYIHPYKNCLRVCVK